MSPSATWSGGKSGWATSRGRPDPRNTPTRTSCSPKPRAEREWTDHDRQRLHLASVGSLALAPQLELLRRARRPTASPGRALFHRAGGAVQLLRDAGLPPPVSE